MLLPEFDDQGNLPVGVHRASVDEVIARFGQGTSRRQLVTSRLIRVYELASNTSKVKRFIIFGSYVTAKAEPNDVDIILIMHDDFTQQECDAETKLLFDHLRAQQEFGASVLRSDLRRSYLKQWIASLTTGRSRETRAGAGSSR